MGEAVEGEDREHVGNLCTSCLILMRTQFTSVQLLSRVRLFVTPWTAAHQDSLSITNSWNLLKLMSIESVMPSNHLNLCHPLLLLPSIFPSIRVFSNESVLHIRWPKDWSFSFSIRKVLNLVLMPPQSLSLVIFFPGLVVICYDHQWQVENCSD